MQSDALRRAIRTGLQLIAAGGLTALVNAAANGLSAAWQGVLIAGWAVVVSYVQNYLEDQGAIPAVLKNGGSQGAAPVPASRRRARKGAGGASGKG